MTVQDKIKKEIKLIPCNKQTRVIFNYRLYGLDYIECSSNLRKKDNSFIKQDIRYFIENNQITFYQYEWYGAPQGEKIKF